MENTSNDVALVHGSGYSADVRLHLRVNGSTFNVAQVAHDRVIFAEPQTLPQGPAEIIAIIDGHETRRKVLIDNRELSRRIVPVVPVEPMAS